MIETVICLIMVGWLFIILVSIVFTYVIIPHNSLKDGLKDWWHESDEDF